MTRKKLIAVVVGSVVVAVIALGVVFGPEWAKNKALDQLSETLGRRVVVEGDWDIDLGWAPTLRLERIRVANAQWSDTPWMAELAALEVSIELGALIDGRIVVPRLHLVEPRVLLERSEDGRANWQFGPGAPEEETTEPADDGEPAQLPIVQDLLITDTRIRYLDHASDMELTSSLPRAQGALTEEQTVFTTHGELDGRPLGFELEAGALNRLNASEQPFPLNARLELDTLNASLEGSVQDPLQPAGLDLRLTVEGEGTPRVVQALTGTQPPTLPNYRVQAALRQQGPQSWQLEEFQLRLGESAMRGSAGLDLSGETPRLTADFTFPRVDVDELSRLASGPASPDDAPEAAPDAEPAQALDLSALRALNADVSLRVEEVTGAQAPLGNASLDLTLEDGRLDIDPLQAEVAGNQIALRGNLDAAEQPATGRFTLNFDEIDLSRTLTAFDVEQPPPGSVTGEITVNITGELEAGDRDLVLPGLGRIQLAPSRLSYTAPSLDTAIDASLRSERQDGEPRLFLTADGRYRGEPFAVDFAGDSPLALRDPSRPYWLDLALDAADTSLAVEGQIARPLEAQGLDLNLAIEGPNPAGLTPLIDFPLPELPPYSIEGHLTRQGETITLTDFSGRVGDSDLSGDIQVDLGGERLTIDATLVSEQLDFDDLAGLIGAPPGTDPGDTASQGQQSEAEQQEDSPYLLPRDSLDLDRATSAMNADIEFRGKRVEASGLPLDEVYFDVEIRDDQLNLMPLEFGLGEGAVRLNLAFDTREEPFTGEVSGEITRINLRQALAPLEIANESLGIVGGRMQFWVEGNSIADFFGSADGGLLLVMTDGRLDVLLIELAGLDVVETLTTLLGDAGSVPIDCAYIELSAEDGIAQLETAVIDTTDTLFLADGTIDFGQEQLDLVIEPRPKDFTLFSLRAPLHIDGQMSDPAFSVGDALMARGLAIAALAAAAPVTALIPLLDPASGEDSVYCGGLVEVIDRARQQN